MYLIHVFVAIYKLYRLLILKQQMKKKRFTHVSVSFFDCFRIDWWKTYFSKHRHVTSLMGQYINVSSCKYLLLTMNFIFRLFSLFSRSLKFKNWNQELASGKSEFETLISSTSSDVRETIVFWNRMENRFRANADPFQNDQRKSTET